MLYSNGTWRTLDSLLPTYTKPESAKTKIEFLDGKAALWLDADVWIAGEEETKDDEKIGINMTMAFYYHSGMPIPENGTKLNAGNNGAMVIGLSLVFPEAVLEELITNKMLKEISDKSVITHKEKRAVNNVVVSFYTASIQKGAEKGTMLIYIYTGKENTVILMAAAETHLFTQYQADLEGFLNGFETNE